MQDMTPDSHSGETQFDRNATYKIRVIREIRLPRRTESLFRAFNRGANKPNAPMKQHPPQPDLTMNNHQNDFAHSIVPQDKLIDLRLREIWQYRDLLFLFVRRDFVAKYKQTILGPAWFFIQPMLQTLVMKVVFGAWPSCPPTGFHRSSSTWPG
jgi:hypothetical protein